MNQEGIAIDDLHAYAEAHLEEIQRPGNVHFTEKGSRKLAERVAASIRQQLSRRLHFFTARRQRFRLDVAAHQTSKCPNHEEKIHMKKEFFVRKAWKKVQNPIPFLSCLFVSNLMFFAGNARGAYPDFYAYHTKVSHSATDYMGRYADLIVVLGKGKQLEFTRQTGYLPRWRTPDFVGTIDDLFPGRDQDFEFNYTYVRLVETGPDKIVVHWRYYPDIKTLQRANQDLNALAPEGFLGVVHEVFTVRPDGAVEREVLEAAGTRSNDWGRPELKTTQRIRLTEKGIEHGSVNWGRSAPFFPRAKVEGNPVKAVDVLPKPSCRWTFDEGMQSHRDRITESITQTRCPVQGLMTVFKKGVSGTALALDGYTSGVVMNARRIPITGDALTLEAWIALDVLPYNTAPVVHRSKGFGREGYYFGVDAYGHLLLTVAGETVKTSATLPLYQWTHVAATVGGGKMILYIDGEEKETAACGAGMTNPETDLMIGLNSETERCTDYVRGLDENLPFVYGIQGLLDEVRTYDRVLLQAELKRSFQAWMPTDRTSALAKGVLPGEVGTGKPFGARYTELRFHELWDNLWRTTGDQDIVVKFDTNPGSVVYWRGTNGAASWVTDNNRWMADQSSEISTKHGCSEHMADKQNRHSVARIIENTPARVVVHWRYPCVDVSYFCANRRNWSDEYHTIYPDGIGVRKVIWDKGSDPPGFQDIQFFTNPGENALDVVDLQAMTVANTDGDVRELTWAKPNLIPENNVPNACIEVLNSKSTYKVFAVFQGGHINPWGAREQSKYLEDPFAGPWNHWPVHLVPSDGRFAVSTDRVTHFALGANDAAPEFGSMVLYGLTDQPIKTLIPLAKSWKDPATIGKTDGLESHGYDKDQRAFVFTSRAKSMSFSISASEKSPLVNPCFVIKNWEGTGKAELRIDGRSRMPGSDFRQGVVIDTEGKPAMVVWIKQESTRPVDFTLNKM